MYVKVLTFLGKFTIFPILCPIKPMKKLSVFTRIFMYINMYKVKTILM